MLLVVITDQVIMEITDMKFADIAAMNGKLPEQKEQEAEEEDKDADLESMQARLAALQ